MVPCTQTVVAVYERRVDLYGHIQRLFGKSPRGVGFLFLLASSEKSQMVESCELSVEMKLEYSMNDSVAYHSERFYHQPSSACGDEHSNPEVL